MPIKGCVVTDSKGRQSYSLSPSSFSLLDQAKKGKLINPESLLTTLEHLTNMIYGRDLALVGLIQDIREDVPEDILTKHTFMRISDIEQEFSI